MKKTVLITGGSRGIGAAAVREFTARGYAAAFFYKEHERQAQMVAEETGAIGIRCDVSCRKAVAEAVKNARIYLGISAFDCLVLNAGISREGLFIDEDESHWKQVFNVNLGGIINVTSEIVQPMINKESGSIVMLSSVWGQTGASCESIYAASKSSILGLAKSLAKELAPSGIRVNAVAPGVIDTDMNACYSPNDMKALAEDIPLGRLGAAEEVAKAICFLASEDASYITGQVLAVNGGFYI